MIDIELERLVVENTNLIYKLARSFGDKNIDDLYQVGVIGLIYAYNNFDFSYNVKFSTYAYPFIIGEMKKYLRENKSIKISRDIMYLSNRLDKLIELLTQKYRRIPTVKELSEETSIEEWKIIEAINIKNCVKSIDEPINDDMTLKDIIEDNKYKEDSELEEMLNKLDLEERQIIENRYLLDKSQREIKKMIGYSQAKVSRIERRVLQKLNSYYNYS